MNDASIYLSDDMIFYTVEGEGRFVGYPSIFMRLSMCNLTCIGFKSEAAPYGCDSYVSWSVKNKHTIEGLYRLFVDKGYIEHLRKGAILKLTGGEPLIQQKQLLAFIRYFAVKEEFIPNIDFETNGTLMPDSDWHLVFNATFTVSPKLSNNGDPEEKRYKPEVLSYYQGINSCFKFVVRGEQDIEEIKEKYMNKEIGITRNQIWLMPCCGSRQEQNEVAGRVAEYCKLLGVKFSPRLHLMIWDKALKV